MAQVPPYEIPEEAPPRKRKSNTVLWVILIVVVGGGCMGLILLAAILYPVFEQARLAAQRSACMSNMRQLARGNLMYAAEYDETFPRKDDWFTAVAPYTARMRRIRCPIAAKNQGPETVGYGMNVALTGHKAPSREKV